MAASHIEKRSNSVGTPTRHSVIVPAAWLAALIAALSALAGCGQSMDVPLPDVSAASGGRQTMTPAEQKRAIDAMVAKRDQPESK